MVFNSMNEHGWSLKRVGNLDADIRARAEDSLFFEILVSVSKYEKRKFRSCQKRGIAGHCDRGGSYGMPRRVDSDLENCIRGLREFGSGGGDRFLS